MNEAMVTHTHTQFQQILQRILKQKLLCKVYLKKKEAFNVSM